MRHTLWAATALASLVVLAACQNNNSRSSGLESSLSPKTGSELNGKWLPTDAAARGVYEAEFRDGVFASRSPGNNKLLAKGSYRIISDKQIDLEFVGAATNTAVKAKCDRPTSNTMYCVPSVGSPFNLQRS